MTKIEQIREQQRQLKFNLKRGWTIRKSVKC